MVRFLTSLVILTFLFLAASYAGFFTTPSFGKEIILYMMLTTGGVYYLLQRRFIRDPKSLTQTYLLSIVLKMLAGCAFIFIIIRADRSAAIPNVVLFIVSYILFTVLEVVFLYYAVSNGRR